MSAGEEVMRYQSSAAITVEVPRNPDEALALDVLQSLWPMLRYLKDAPERYEIQVKVAVSNTVWDSLCRLRFGSGMSPVDVLARTLFGFEVVVNNWARERAEIVLPVEIRRSR